MRKSLLLLILFAAFTLSKLYAQTTYYWAGGNTGTKTWNTAANWSTTLGGGGSQRTTPATTDILIFDGSNLGAGATGALTVSTLVTETEAQIKFINNANITLGHSSTRTITIAGGTGDDFVIEAGSSVTFGFTSFASAVTLQFGAGATGNVAGMLTLQLASHKMLPDAAANCITFTGTSVLNNNVTSGNVFGSNAVSTNNNVVFQSGSTFNFGGTGSNPFGASAPASVVEFQPGSNYIHSSATLPQTSNRFYANFKVNFDLSLTSNFGAVQNIEINSGKTLTINHTSRIPVKGNIINNGTLVTGTSIPNIIMCGNTPQIIDFGSSSPTFGNLIIAADANVTLNSNWNNAPSPNGSNSAVLGTLDLQGNVFNGVTDYSFSVKNRASSTTNVTTVLNGNSITVADGTGIVIGMLVTAAGIPANTYIVSGSSPTYTISNRATAAGTVSGTFSSGYGHLKTSHTGGLVSALNGITTFALNGVYTFNAATTTPFPTSLTSISLNTLNIAANVTLNKLVNLDSLVNVTAGVLTTAGLLTLKSTASNTARVSSVASGAILGNVNVQRYIPGGRRAYRFFGNPFSNDISLSQLTTTNGANTGIDVTGVGVGSVAASGTAVLTGDVVTSITVDNGSSGYLSAPTVTLTGDGTGATATATISSGSVTGFIVTNGGSGYTTPPTVILTGGFGFTPTVTNNPSAFKYDPSVGDAGTNPDPGWSAFTNAITNNWNSKQGIRVLVRGTKGEGLSGGTYTPSATTVTLTGTLNDGSSPSFSLISGATSSYNLIANPLASPIDMQALTLGGSNVGANFDVWDANLGSTGGYATRPFTAAGTYRYLPIGGAFFAQTSSTGSITFPESAKVSTAPASLFRGTSVYGNNSIELELFDNTGLKHDGIIFFLDNAASNSFDSRDGLKMINPSVNFFANSADSKKLSIDARPFVIDNIIPLTINTSIGGSFVITSSNFNVDDVRDILLHDKMNNTYTTLNAGVSYNFTVILNDATTFGNRFELVMRSSNALPATFLNVKAAQKNAAIEVSWSTANEVNMSSYEVEESTDGVNFTKATTVAAINAVTNTYSWLDASIINGDNFYRIKSVEQNGTFKYSNVVKVKVGVKNTEFTVYPNPVKGGVVSVQMSNVEKGIYTVKIFNQIGQELANKTINHTGGSATQTIDLGKTVAAGAYKMNISNGITSITKTVIVE